MPRDDESDQNEEGAQYRTDRAGPHLPDPEARETKRKEKHVKHLTSNPQEPKGSRFAKVKDVGEFMFAAVLALYGIFGYYLIRDQWLVMQRQADVMEQQTKVMQAQLKDARKAAAEGDKVTERQLKIAESQASSLSNLAIAAKTSADAAKEQAGDTTQQVGLMRDQLSDTRRATKASAEGIERQLIIADTQAASMKALADANRVMADAANVNADASKRAAETISQQLEVTDRPWLSVAVSITEPIKFFSLASGYSLMSPEFRKQVEAISPEFWSMNEVKTRAEITVTNAGRSVANGVHIISGLVVEDAESTAWIDEPAKQAFAMCEIGVADQTSGRVLFPGKNAVEHTTRWGEPLTTYNGKLALIKKSFTLRVVGCATYKFNNSPTLHRTWFTYRVGIRAPRDDAWTWNVSDGVKWWFTVGKEVPLRSIVVEKLPQNGNGAD